MIGQEWSWILTSIGATGWVLTGRRLWQGWAVGLAVQVLWLAYAVATRQWGFVAASLLYGGIAAINLRKWLRPTGQPTRKHEFDDDDIAVLAAGLARRYGTPYDDDHQVRAVGLLSEVMADRYRRDDTRTVPTSTGARS